MILFISAPAPAQFIDVSASSGLATAGIKDGGLSWGDFDSDGCLDVLVNTDQANIASQLYLQDAVGATCSGTFTNVTACWAPGLEAAKAERSAIWGDINNDGLIDFARDTSKFIEIYLNNGSGATPCAGTSVTWTLFGNAGDPSQIIDSSPIGHNSEGLGWIDYDADGDLDLSSVNHTSLLIYDNDGTGSFSFVDPTTIGLPGDGSSSAGDYSAVTDLDADGHVDFLARLDGTIDLYLNNGDGTFSTSTFDEISRNNNKGGVAFCDFDDDGDFDIFWTDAGTNQIWEQTGVASRSFVGLAVPSGITGDVDGVACQDMDNDGDLDLMLTTDADDLLFRNDGGFVFTDVTPTGMGAADGEGVAFGDYDRDGDLDLLINQAAGNELWQNDTNNTNYLMVQPLHYDSGNGTTRAAIGATVTLYDCFGTRLTGVREVNGGRGHGCQDPPLVHFGLPTTGMPSGPSGEYIVRVQFVGGGSVAKAVVPSSLGTYQMVTLQSSDTSDISACTTEVRLSSFTATGGNESVELAWETASEWNNLGFHLYRSLSKDGPYEPITDVPIPGLGSSPLGARYSYLDRGLVNGSTYYYKLEDIETTGRTELHGPVHAAPSPGDTGSESSTPAPYESNPEARIIYGEPSESQLRILSRDHGHLLMELTTAGFTATLQEDGTVRLEVPGLEVFQGAGSPAVPVRRTWVEAVDGRKVKLVSVRSDEVESFSGLDITQVEAPEVAASSAGIVRACRGRSRSPSKLGGGLYPRDEARVVDVGFQGDVKKALIELAPIRWDAAAGLLYVARRLVIRLSFLTPETEPRPIAGWQGSGQRAVVARLGTTEQGLYALRYEDLFGGEQRGRPSRQIRLSRQGIEVPYHLEPDTGRFQPGSVLYFFSEGARANPYGPQAIYELEVGAEGKEMAVVQVSPTGPQVPFAWRNLEIEQNRLYTARLLDAPDVWLWDVLSAPVEKSYSFEVGRLAPSAEEALVTVWLQGGSDLLPYPDHHVRVYVNGNFAGELTWNGKTPRRLEAPLTPGVLHEGRNHLILENVGDTEAAYSLVMLDRFEVLYPRLLQAEEGVWEGRAGRSGTVSVRGFDAAPLVLDITDAPRWLTGAECSGEGAGTLRVESGRHYWANDVTTVLRPKVNRARPVRLKEENHQADYIVIGPRFFLDVAEPLLARRRRQGLRVEVAAVEDIYDEFGFGEPVPEALKHFLAYAYHHWREPAVRYVLLLGDATYDFKDYLETGVQNRVPPLILKTSFLWTASDPGYALVNGNDDLPDLSIGRLPAASADELRTMVNKILDYETSGAPLGAPVVLVADDADEAGDFRADAELLAAEVISPTPVDKIYLDEMQPAAARASVVDAFDRGAFLLSYLGHGGIHLWADENIFSTSHVDSLSPQGDQPLVITMNCLNGYFHFPFFDSLSERLLKAHGRGAVAAFSPSGLSLNRPAQIYHQALVKEILHGGHTRLGDAVFAAQVSFAETGAFPELLSIFHLLGDPALDLTAR